MKKNPEPVKNGPAPGSATLVTSQSFCSLLILHCNLCLPVGFPAKCDLLVVGPLKIFFCPENVSGTTFILVFRLLFLPKFNPCLLYQETTGGHAGSGAHGCPAGICSGSGNQINILDLLEPVPGTTDIGF